VRVEYSAKGVICHGLKGKGMKRGYRVHNTQKKRRTT